MPAADSQQAGVAALTFGVFVVVLFLLVYIYLSCLLFCSRFSEEPKQCV